MHPFFLFFTNTFSPCKRMKTPLVKLLLLAIHSYTVSWEWGIYKWFLNTSGILNESKPFSHHIFIWDRGTQSSTQGWRGQKQLGRIFGNTSQFWTHEHASCFHAMRLSDSHQSSRKNLCSLFHPDTRMCSHHHHDRAQCCSSGAEMSLVWCSPCLISGIEEYRIILSIRMLPRPWAKNKERRLTWRSISFYQSE